MSDAESLTCLQLLTLLNQQLPDQQAHALMLLATDNPDFFRAEVVAAEKAGHIRLPRHMTRMLRLELLERSPQAPGDRQPA